MNLYVNQYVTICIAFTVMAGCRTNLRPQTSAADPVKVEITVVGLQDADKSRSELVYTLSNCGVGSVSGKKLSAETVQFMAAMVAKDDICKVQVNTANSESDALKWFDDPGLLYEAQNVAIRSDSGKLNGTAYLQQKYSNALTLKNDKVVKNIAKVILPESANTTCTCTLTCAPALPINISELDPATDNKSGSCTFANLAKAELASSECSKLRVQCGDKLYTGEWKPATKFDGSAAKEYTFPELTLTSTNITEISDTVIEVVVPTKK